MIKGRRTRSVEGEDINTQNTSQTPLMQQYMYPQNLLDHCCSGIPVKAVSAQANKMESDKHACAELLKHTRNVRSRDRNAACAGGYILYVHY